MEKEDWKSLKVRRSAWSLLKRLAAVRGVDLGDCIELLLAEVQLPDPRPIQKEMADLQRQIQQRVRGRDGEAE